MWNIKTIFTIVYIIDMLLTIAAFKVALNGDSKNKFVIGTLLFNLVCLYLFHLSSKIYLLLGLGLSITFAMLFSLMDDELESQMKVTFTNKIIMIFMAMLFWPQVLATNYAVINSMKN